MIVENFYDSDTGTFVFVLRIICEKLLNNYINEEKSKPYEEPFKLDIKKKPESVFYSIKCTFYTG